MYIFRTTPKYVTPNLGFTYFFNIVAQGGGHKILIIK